MTGRRFHVMFLAAFAAVGVFSPSVAAGRQYLLRQR